jgi:hypothetical protein
LPDGVERTGGEIWGNVGCTLLSKRKVTGDWLCGSSARAS